MTMIRSSSGIAREMAPKRTVLPVPVPPEISMFFRRRTQISRNSLAASERLPKPIRSSSVSTSRLNLRMVRYVPVRALGGMMAWTRKPLGSRASSTGCSGTDLPAHPLGDVVNRREQGVVAGESGVGVLQAAVPLDVDVVVAVDHDLRDRFVLQQGKDRLQEVLDAGFEDRLPGHGSRLGCQGKKGPSGICSPSLFRRLHHPLRFAKCQYIYPHGWVRFAV